MTEEVDVVVAGGGVAGAAAAMHAARLGLRTVVLTPEGQMGALATIDVVENFPGLDGVAGYELLPGLHDQALAAGAEIRSVPAVAADREAARWRVTTRDGELVARALIAATGTRPRELAVPGARELVGRGVSECASCDGPLFKGRHVAVLGGGDSGLQEALTLVGNGVTVRVYELTASLTAQSSYRTRIAARRVEVRVRQRVEAILGEHKVEGIRVLDESTGTSTEDAVDGVFVYVGRDPESAWLAGTVALDGTGRIPTDAAMRAREPGLFAAGDIRADGSGQAAGAAGDGLAAATSAVAYLAARS